jgi:hypothetical protein
MSNIAKILLTCCLMSAALAAATPSQAAAQCPAETEIGRQLVLDFATKPTRARPAGIPVVSATQVRLLTNAGDSGVCSQLFNVFWAQWQNPDEPKPNWRWAFYQVGDLYYVIAHRTTPPVRRNLDGTLNVSLSWSPLYVIDRGYHVLASFAR